MAFEDIDNFQVKDDETQEPDWNSIELKVDEIKKAINKLADGYRVVLTLYLLEGYDHEEIAEILNISNSSSRSQLTRAKQKLLQNLTAF